MRTWKILLHLLLTLLLSIGASGIASAKVASGSQNLVWTGHQAESVFNWLTCQGKSDRSTTGPPECSVVPKSGSNVPLGVGSGRNTSRSFDTGGPTTSRPASFPQGNSQTQHIFRDAPGHLADTPANRSLLQGVANDSRTTLGTDRFGNTWSARSRSDGSQVWVQTRNGVIQNGGVNSTPRTFNPQTGLSGR
jgi:hypothetical protein